MTRSELEEWLQTEDSATSGWSKNDGSGESVGHDSGRRIVEILKKNPDKDPGEQANYNSSLGLGEAERG